MAARALLASCALLAFAYAASAQDAVIIVDVTNRTHPHPRTTHSRQTSINEYVDIVTQLQSAKADALQLYTDFASRTSNDLKLFLRNITGFADGIIRNCRSGSPYENEDDECWVKFEYRLKKIEHDARKAAVYSADNHHKYVLGHMIVFRMHLNKSEEFIRRCDKVTRNCGLPCETTPRVRRWRRLALDEIHRVRDDMQFTRRSYRDLVCHARRKLNQLRRQAFTQSRDAVEEYRNCVNIRV